MNNLIIPDYLNYLLVGLYIMNLTFSVIISIGWLTCANYYYRLCHILDDIIVSIFIIFVCIITSFLVISYVFSNSDPSFRIGILGTNALIVCSVLIFVLIGSIYELISRSRRYFANKRGRTID